MCTPTKFSDHIISPLFSHQFCLLCFKNVNEYKSPKDQTKNLFYPNGQKQEFCEILEEYLRVKITDKDLKIVCRNCFKSVKNDLKHQGDKKSSLLKIRGTVEEHHLVRRVKRCLPTDVDVPPESKKTDLERPDSRRRLTLESSVEREQWPFHELARNSAPPHVPFNFDGKDGMTVRFLSGMPGQRRRGCTKGDPPVPSGKYPNILFSYCFPLNLASLESGHC